MRGRTVSRLSRRALFGAMGCVAFAAVLGASAPKAQEQQDVGQAEWPQSYETSPQMAIQREATPILSQATIDATQAAIQKYQDIVSRGGWNIVPGGSELQVGSKGRGVEDLRQRLVATGDLDPVAGSGQVYDSFVEAGVKRFQARNGLNKSGVVDKETLAALNVSAAARLQQLETNLIRLRAYSGDLGERFVIVNLPGASVETVENGVVYSHHRAGVGRIDRQSPIMQTKATEINFNPYWHVPPSLIKKDLIPKMKADPNYLTEEKIHILDKDGQEVSPSSINWSSDDATHFTYRQDPGSELDALGFVRINIPNPYGVYMHDTPEKGVFGDDFRFVSSGCVRVQDVRDYVAWLLKDNPGWTRDQIDEVIRSGQQQNVKLTQPVNVYWIYVTAWATPDGVVQFRPDIYQRDGAGPGPLASAVPTQPLALPQE
jgi:murein L,D-transpeptidase YcbB/YkuD